MSPTDAKALIEMLAIVLIAVGFLFWRYGPCGHEECKRTHAKMEQNDKEAALRARHARHVANKYVDATCRSCVEETREQS